MRMGPALGNNLFVPLAQGIQIHSVIDAYHRSRVSRDIVEDEVAEVTVDFRVRLPVTGVAIVFVLIDLIKGLQIVDGFEIHPESVFGSCPGDIAFEFFQFLGCYLEDRGYLSITNQ